MIPELATLEISIRKEFPGFKTVPKSASLWMKFVDLLLKLLTFWRMNKFMVSFVTTIGDVVYTPSHWDQWDDVLKMVILRHERVHMRQSKRYTRLLFRFLYLFAPLPVVFSYFRMKFEREAYEETMRARAEYGGVEGLRDPEYRSAMIDHFTTGQYLWMWPWRGGLEAWYDQTVLKIASESR